MNNVLRRSLLLYVVFVMSAQASAFGDIIYLKNGGKINGTVVKDNGATVLIDIGRGTVVQNKKDIVRIKKEEMQKSSVSAPASVKAPELFDAESPKPDFWPVRMVKSIVGTVFSILRFDFLKKK